MFPHHALGDGEAAYLPWLQATPDPLTSVAWQTWVEVNPRLARAWALNEGDIVALESPVGSNRGARVRPSRGAAGRAGQCRSARGIA